MVLTARSQGSTTAASSLAAPTPLSGPQCRLLMSLTRVLARARCSCPASRGSPFSSSVSRSKRVLCSGRGLMESVSRSLRTSGGSVLRRGRILGWASNSGRPPSSSIPSATNLCVVSFATRTAWVMSLCTRGECGHRVRFNAVALNSELLAFHQRGPGAAEGIQNNMVGIQGESVDVGPHQVGGE